MTTTTAKGTVGYVALWVADVDRAADFFSAVLGWSYTEAGSPHRMVEGAKPHHGIVALDALPPGVWESWSRHATLFLSHGVDDVDAAVRQIRAAGGHAAEPVDERYGRAANCTDDQGMPFAIHADTGSNPSAPTSPGHGELVYLTFEVSDTDKARTFFGTVFGWGFSPGNIADGWQIEGLHPMGGMHGGHERPTVVPMYAVDDIDTAVARVRQAGGTATDAEERPFGSMSTCADDQGTRFYLGNLG